MNSNDSGQARSDGQVRNRKLQLMRRVSRIFPKQHTKWFAAGEQVGISGNNFLVSFLIVRFGGIETLGEYSFWFVVCQFFSMFALGLCVQQMVLRAAASSFPRQRDALAVNCLIVASYQVFQTLALIILVWLKPPENDPMLFLFSVVLFTASLNASELFRQYLYMRGRQRLSFIYTGISLGISFLGFAAIVFFSVADKPSHAAFWMQALGQTIFVVFAISVTPGLFTEIRLAKKRFIQVQREQLKHGLPLVGGMLVMWLQNKSVTPILMFTMGPLFVGYYALANMIITPANMITTGLSKSALPQIRRAFGDGNNLQLGTAISAHRKTSMRVVGGYTLAVLVGWLVAESLGLIHSHTDLFWMFLATIVVAILSNYRFWYSQHFVVRMDFGFLMRIGIVATSITISIMLFAGVVLKLAPIVVIASAIGELCLLYALRKKLVTAVPAI